MARREVSLPRAGGAGPRDAGRGRARGAALRAAPLALALVLGAGLARAQSLGELYGAAHAYDATYLSARAQAESAPYRVEQARALLRPNLALAGSAVRSYSNPALGESYGSHSFNLQISGRQPLFNRANVANLGQAERSLEASNAELAAAEQDLILRLSQAYFDVLAAQDTLATTRTSMAAISEQLASARRNFEVGTATITDTREAQARYDLARAQEIAAQNDLNNRQIVLDQLVGRSNVAPRPLAAPVTLPDVPAGNIDVLAADAANGHPQVRRAQAAYEIAQLETEKARAGRLPTIDAIASLGAGRSTVAAGQTGNNAGSSIGVQLNLPLYTGGQVQARIAETLALEERYRNDLEAVRRLVTQQTRQAYYTLGSSAAQVRALEAAESSSQLALEATQLGYRVGVRVNLDVLNAQTQLFQTRRDLARARYDVLLGTLRLRQAAGQLAPADLVAVDAVLTR
ncbi:TolC family outer membrane protein [Piscinibacter koreensis]|uniref:TolC family outer membrane protein n=1 Tax=Piscinibacter koreensis TaxID=2742824 RepID=A0A7Y6NMQ4_9BURK|nr:TolC family outer membrane protein [Schlegelella koreensis]NUZ06010.1 TolC family outer membrane protein [Schlegelella koreensis]